MLESKSHPAAIAVIDVETTGLFPMRQDRIVEIGIVIMQADGKVLTEFDTLVNPKRDIGPTSIHGLTSENVLGAPTFGEIAGNVLDSLAGTVALAGHNVRFDYQFLKAEFGRLGYDWPECHLVCTMQLAGGGGLSECCNTFGVGNMGEEHKAIADARAAGRLLAELLRDQPRASGELAALKPIIWPRFDGERRAPLTRIVSKTRLETETTYLQQLLRQRSYHALPEETDGAAMAYGALLDRALEDRLLDELESESLVGMATQWGLDNTRVAEIHEDYLGQLVVTALADGRVSESERDDLKRVARLLGKDQVSLDRAIEDALEKLREPQIVQAAASRGTSDLKGLKVCFTGELQGQVAGKRISREMAERFAEEAGLTVVDAVTKSCDLLVLADAGSQSGKARKARALGVRAMHERVFWMAIGVRAA
jgi:DNA polymerase-3 subunit epsilon